MATTKQERDGSTRWDEIEAALRPAARGVSKAKAADARALRE